MPVHFSLLIPRMSTFTLLFDHFQFALIHGPNIPGPCAILLFTASDLASFTSHTHNWVLFCFGSIPSFFLDLFLHWSPVAYWAPTDLGSSSFSILSFCLSYCSWGFQGKNTEVACHSLLQWATFCQTSPPWPGHLGLPHRHGLVHWVRQGCGPSVIRLISFLWVWFQCVCSLMPSCNTYHHGFLLPWAWGIS